MLPLVGGCCGMGRSADTLAKSDRGQKFTGACFLQVRLTALIRVFGSYTLPVAALLMMAEHERVASACESCQRRTAAPSAADILHITAFHT